MTSQDFSGSSRDHHPLAERTIVVIGPTTALASAIARVASERGARVAVATTGAPGDESTATSHVTSDFASEAEIDRLFDVALAQLSRLDIVVAVLDVPPLHALHTLSLERWRARIAGPLRLAFWLARRALDELVASDDGGRIIFVVNRPDGEPVGDGLRIVAEAVASLARSLAREYGRRAVSCQVVVQAGPDGEPPPTADPHRALVECVLFLASAAAAFVTGEIVAVGNAVAPPPGATGTP